MDNSYDIKLLLPCSAIDFLVSDYVFIEIYIMGRLLDPFGWMFDDLWHYPNVIKLASISIEWLNIKGFFLDRSEDCVFVYVS